MELLTTGALRFNEARIPFIIVSTIVRMLQLFLTDIYIYIYIYIYIVELNRKIIFWQAHQ